MSIFITGGTGFVGRHLVAHLLEKGHRITMVGRRDQSDWKDEPRLRYISADTTRCGLWQEALGDFRVVINLAGQSIFGRWNRRYKRRLYDSRVLTTRNLVDALPQTDQAVLISASAPGYYGDRGDEILKEDEPSGNDFLAGICKDWEKEARQAQKKGWRVVIARLGIVLGADGGALEKMVPAFRSFLGGSIGKGRQWFPWVHIEDLLAALGYFMENDAMKGPFNVCAPQTVRYATLAKTMGSVLKRPAGMPAPAFMVRMALGEFGGTLLNSHRLSSELLVQSGFDFQYELLESALRHLLTEQD